MTSHQPPRPPSEHDPLVDEVRSIRRELSAQFDDDVRRLGEHLWEVQRSSKQRVIRQPDDAERRRAAS